MAIRFWVERILRYPSSLVFNAGLTSTSSKEFRYLNLRCGHDCDRPTNLAEILLTTIIYWQNCNYGVFGSYVKMKNPPLLANGHKFDRSRIQLIDINRSSIIELTLRPFK